MSKPLVSIIMGAYNCENSISECIDSVLAQTYSNWEFVICDDCSTDNTLSILKEYENKDSRIVVLHNEKNSRLAASLNNCLQVANGEYIARMDADDKCLPDRLEKQVDFLDNNPDFAVVGGAVNVFDGENVTGMRKPKEYPTAKNVLYGPTFMHPTIMMRKSCYEALGGYTVSSRTVRGQDWDLWFRFYAAGFKGCNLQEPVLIYHESASDYKKRSLKAATMYSRTAINGYKLLKVPFWKYYLTLKPIISALMPARIMMKYHSRKLKK